MQGDSEAKYSYDVTWAGYIGVTLVHDWDTVRAQETKSTRVWVRKFKICGDMHPERTYLHGLEETHAI